MLDVPCSTIEEDVQGAAHAGDKPFNKAIAWSQTWVDVSLLHRNVDSLGHHASTALTALRMGSRPAVLLWIDEPSFGLHILLTHPRGSTRKE